MIRLKKKFTDSWSHNKSSSSKLTFYNKIKHAFGRETYLDVSKGFTCRSSTTKLRISAHDLQIEKGRYFNIAKENRICHWCQTSMGSRLIEDEEHVLINCDLYAGLRQQLITRLNKHATLLTNTQTENICSQSHIISNSNMNLENIMNLISPHTVLNSTLLNTNHTNTPHESDLAPTLSHHSNKSVIHKRNYLINCITSYFNKKFDKRHKYLRSIKENKTMPKTIIISFL